MKGKEPWKPNSLLLGSGERPSEDRGIQHVRAEGNAKCMEMEKWKAGQGIRMPALANTSAALSRGASMSLIVKVTFKQATKAGEGLNPMDAWQLFQTKDASGQRDPSRKVHGF